MNTFLIGSILIAFTFSFGSCLECYSCDSSQSKLCNFGLASFVMPTVDCDKQETNVLASFLPKQCAKFTAKDKDGNEFVARGCIPYSGGVCDAIFSTVGFFSEISGGAKDVHCYPCSGDKCNSSFNLKPSMTATVIISALFFFLKL